MKELSTYFSSGTLDRSAVIMIDQHGVFWVSMYQGEHLVETRSMEDHNESYAEDCAENWVEGWAAFSGLPGASDTSNIDLAAAEDEWYNDIFDIDGDTTWIK